MHFDDLFLGGGCFAGLGWAGLATAAGGEHCLGLDWAGLGWAGLATAAGVEHGARLLKTSKNPSSASTVYKRR